MRRLLLTLLASGLAVAACGGDDGGETAGSDPSTTTTTAPDGSTTTTEPRPVDSTFVPEDVDAPSGVAEPLLDVATFGQLAVDAGATVDSLPEDAAAIQGAAVEAATILIAYGNEACGIDVPLFDAIAGV